MIEKFCWTEKKQRQDGQTEYCNDCWYSETGPKNNLLTELEMMSPPPREDEDDEILYEEVEEQ